jgi:cytoskeleton protein RodZ
MKNDSTLSDLLKQASQQTDASNMSASDENFVLTNPAPKPEEPDSVGQLLQHAREQMGLSVTDIATRLRMGAKQIEALERADYAGLPAGTFLRGFVRNYAKSVGVNADEALALLERTNTSATPVHASRQVTPVAAAAQINVNGDGALLNLPAVRIAIAVLLTLFIVAAGYYWWNYMRAGAMESSRPKTEAKAGNSAVTNTETKSDVAASPSTGVQQPATTDTAITLAPSTALPSATPVSPSTETLPPGTVAAPPQSAPFAASDAASTSSPVTPAISLPAVREKPADQAAAPETPRRAGTSIVGFTFTAESWVEVVDATGKTILSKRFKAGDAEEITGRGPLAVVVGNAQATRMAYNGREFDLKPHTRSTVARVTLK